MFILDDYHTIDGSAAHHVLAFLLDNLPPVHHFVLAGRGEPSLPLARYRAHHALLELRSEDLSFSVDETIELLNRLMALDLPRDQIALLCQRSERIQAGL